MSSLVRVELCLTGRLLEPAEALRLGVVGAVHPAGELMRRARALAGEIAAAPPSASLETKRRILVERESCWQPLFAREEEALREALLGT